MQEKNIINQGLEIVFNTLREEEHQKKGKLCEILDPFDEYAILMNRRYKKENELELTDLEEEIGIEEGENIRCYIAEIYSKLKMNQKPTIPFPQYSISIQELNQKLEEYKARKETKEKVYQKQ